MKVQNTSVSIATVCLVVSFSITWSTPTYASKYYDYFMQKVEQVEKHKHKYKYKKSKKSKKGVRHQLDILSQRIDELESSMGDVTIQLGDLQIQVQTNSASIDETKALASTIQSNLSELEMTVMNNLTTIEEVSMTISMLSTEVEYQKSQLMTTLLEQNAAIDAQSEQLEALEESLLILGQNNISMAQELENRLLDLESSSGALDNQINDMQTQIIQLNGQLSASNAEYNYLLLVVQTLETALDQAQVQITQLENTVALLESGVGGGMTGGDSSAPAVFIFTDTYVNDDTVHVTQLRQFFEDHSDIGKWVYASFVTSAINRSTEVCFKDSDDMFDQARIQAEHGYDDKRGGEQVTYRLNNGEWVGAEAARVQSRNSNGSNFVFTGVFGNDVATGALINITSSLQDYDSYHQRRYQTVESKTDTVVSFVIADDRMSACGF